MQDKRGVCWNCRYYKPFYLKGYCHFDRQKSGMCVKQQKSVNCRDGCGEWEFSTEFNNGVRRVMNKESALKSISEMQKDLSEIRQILDEAFKEDEGDI